MANIAELDRVMTFIKDNPEKHDQKVWANECGTAACMAGWACLLNGYSINTEEIESHKRRVGPYGVARFGGPVFDPDGRKASIQESAMDILDLDMEDAEILFGCENTIEELELMVKDLANGEYLDDRWRSNPHNDRYIRRDEP